MYISQDFLWNIKAVHYMQYAALKGYYASKQVITVKGRARSTTANAGNRLDK